MRFNLEPKWRNVVDGKGPKVSDKIREIVFRPVPRRPSGPTFAAAIAAALTRAHGIRHSAVKVVAGAVGANERAVRNWFEAKNGPSGEHLLRLISHSDEMLDSVLTMAGKKEITAGVQIADSVRARIRAGTG